ncbi:hypothetical protein P0D91_14225 [Pseudomonas sp. CBSPBW29]|nr:hypothetical protein P0D91_14225 [Pseudomonas sp. CBSPBW29]WEL66327.1 hypothetical protein P0D93_08375 [Pseudomonas sp. CBSPGW29]WEL69799.1 hypothetical protein P0D94_27690 [Pseudomonas sp. CBSPCGW29]WEL76766.1 hypothetical protein P0D92_00305 [Pseudomonas sp. CBSPAW29]WEL84632.1 hypothetical protein P0D95_12055 [Pseudomonas sp. CBSPCAW29]WEL87459.1 hypothetical protein P0D90_27785 [Pseudomonas sp. CBSPCBW29]
MDIPLITRMAAIVWAHKELDMRDAEDQKLKRLMDKLPAEDTNRPVQFDKTKKTHREVGFLIQHQSISWPSKNVA